MNTILDFFDNSVHNFSNKTAIITKEKTCTYKQLSDFSHSVAALLQKYSQKNVVSIVMENSVDSIGAYLGVLRSGCIAHLISPNSSKDNIADQLNSANPILILGKRNLTDTIETTVDKIDLSTVKHVVYESKITIEPEHTAYLIYTSGTTSKPKGAAVSHSNAVFTTKNIISILGYRETDKDVLPLPLSHSFGLGCMHTSFFVGSTIILHRNTMNSQEILDSIISNDATTFAAVPATLTKLLDEYANKLNRYFSDLRLVMTNSTTIQKKTVVGLRQILKKGKLATYYGLTEASRSTFMIFDLDGKESSVGIPAPDVQIKLVDQDGNETTNGEIWIKGSNVIKSYWSETSESIPIGDWLKTGDLGYLDDDGYLYLKGRIDDMINVAGEKVNPLDVERAVKLLVDVEEAVAIGVQHESFGQVVKLFVKKTMNSAITKSDIITHCIKNLERYKVPLIIEFVNDFPKTEYGKIKRFMLE